MLVFPTIPHAIAVGIDLVGLCAEDVFDDVGQAIGIMVAVAIVERGVEAVRRFPGVVHAVVVDVRKKRIVEGHEQIVEAGGERRVPVQAQAGERRLRIVDKTEIGGDHPSVEIQVPFLRRIVRPGGQPQPVGRATVRVYDRTFVGGSPGAATRTIPVEGLQDAGRSGSGECNPGDIRLEKHTVRRGRRHGRLGEEINERHPGITVRDRPDHEGRRYAGRG
ncbi:MAG: hypothetical protein HYV75_09105 [Opitutae bacterium]|nr:hypothetical protein [Opitutae bacterium]